MSCASFASRSFRRRQTSDAYVGPGGTPSQSSTSVVVWRGAVLVEVLVVVEVELVGAGAVVVLVVVEVVLLVVVDVVVLVDDDVEVLDVVGTGAVVELGSSAPTRCRSRRRA